MPTPQVNWAGWEFSLIESGTLRILDHSEWIADFSLSSPGWELVEIEEFPDELTARWRTAGANLVVRHNFDATWTMRLAVTNESGGPLELLVPAFGVVSAWPTLSWDGQEQGWLVFDRSDDILAGELVMGSMELIEKTDELTMIRLSSESQLALEAEGARRSLQVVWRFEPRRSGSELAAKLPRWWPEKTTLSLGEEVEIELPDGSITGDRVVQSEDGFVLVADSVGARSALVHQGRLTTRLDWHGAPSVAEVLRRRAAQLIREVENPDSIQQFLVLKAIANQLIPLDGEVRAWLALGGQGITDVFAPANFTLRAQISGDDALLVQALELASGLPQDFGANLVWVGAALQCQLRGLPLLPPPSGSIPDGFAGELVRAEKAVLSSTSDPGALADLRTTLNLLGAGLPVSTVSVKSLARIVCLARHLPEGIESKLGEAWNWGAAIQSAEGRLLASGVDDETLAWLSF